MPGTTGGQMLLGIRLQMDAKGVVTGASLAEGALDRIQGKARRTQTAVANAATGMGDAMAASMGIGAVGGALVGVGAKIGQVIQPMAQQAKTFQTGLSRLGFVARATKEEMAELEGVAIKTGLATQWSPQEAIDGLRTLRQSGLTTKESLDALKPALDLATGSAGELGLARAAKTAAVAMMKFKHTGAPVRELMDALTHSTRESNIEFRDLPIILNSLRTAPQQLKMTSTEALTLVGALKNSGMMAAQAGQSLAGFARGLVNNEKILDRYLLKQKMTTAEFQKMDVTDITKGRGLMKVRAIKELGVSMFDLAGKLRKPKDIILDLVRNLERLSGESEAKYLKTVSAAFTEQARSLLIGLVGLERGTLKGSEAFKDMMASMGDFAGASREASAAIENTQQGLEKFIEGTEDTINILMGKTLLPYMQSFNMSWRTMLNGFLEYIEENPAVAEALGITMVALSAVATAAGSAMLALAGLYFWTQVVGPALVAAGGFAGIAATGFAALQAALWPMLIIGAVILGVFALAMAGVKLWKMIWEEDAGAFLTTIRYFIQNVQMIWRGLKEFWDGEGDINFKEKLEAAGLWGTVQRILAVKDRIVAVYKGVWEGIKDVFMPVAVVFKWIGDALGYVIDGINWLVLQWKGVDIGKMSDDWFKFGRLLGWFAGIVLGALIIKMVLWIATLIGATAVQIAHAAAVMYTAFAYSAFLILFGVVVVAFIALMWKWIKVLWEFGKNIWDVFTQSRDAGLGLMQSLLNGLKSGWNAIVNFLTSAAQWIADILPGSDAKIGPLMHITESGGGLMRALQTGVEAEAPAMQATVTHAMAGVSTAVTPHVGGAVASKGPTTINVQKMEFRVSKGTPEELEQIAKQIMDKIREATDDDQEVAFA